MRTYVTPDDVKALARPVLAHRLLVSPEAQLQGVTSAQVLEQILEAYPCRPQRYVIALTCDAHSPGDVGRDR